MIYADVIVDISHEKLDRSFQYLVPEELEKEFPPVEEKPVRNKETG